MEEAKYAKQCRKSDLVIKGNYYSRLSPARGLRTFFPSLGLRFTIKIRSSPTEKIRHVGFTLLSLCFFFPPVDIVYF